MENYGYNIIDLGKDVDPKIIVDTIREKNIKLAGLSALMTTTAVNMQKPLKQFENTIWIAKLWSGAPLSLLNLQKA